MGLAAEAAAWLSDPSRWTGAASIPARLLEHLQITGISVGLAATVAIPAGLYIGHARRAEFLIVSVANLGRAIPSFAIVALAVPVTIRLGLGLGFWPSVIALFALAIPPLLTNAYAGVHQVDHDALDAATAMGMSGGQLLRRVEVPLAAPLIAAGIRTAVVQVIATATLAALVAWGGLGRFIIDGFATGDDAMILGGAILVAVLAVLAEAVLSVAERAVRPRTTSG